MENFQSHKFHWTIEYAIFYWRDSYMHSVCQCACAYAAIKWETSYCFVYKLDIRFMGGFIALFLLIIFASKACKLIQNICIFSQFLSFFHSFVLVRPFVLNDDVCKTRAIDILHDLGYPFVYMFTRWFPLTRISFRFVLFSFFFSLFLISIHNRHTIYSM